MGKSVYLIGLIATIAIFVVVIFTIKSFEDSRFYGMNEQLKQIALEGELERVYSEMYAPDSNKYCDFLGEQISSLSTRLYDLDTELGVYKETFISSDYVSVKKAFLITNLSLLAKAENAKKVCGTDIKPVIYFYAEDKSCEIECGTMGNQLTQIRNECPNVRVFAFPFRAQSFEFTKLLEMKYDVTKAGTIVIGEKKYDSVQNKEVLLDALGCNRVVAKASTAQIIVAN